MLKRMTLTILSLLISISTLIPQFALAGWKVPFDGSDSKPTIHNGTIYIGSFDGAIYAIDPKDGKQIWRYQTGAGLTSGPEIIRAPGNTFEDQLGAALNATGEKGKGKREIDATPVIENETVYIGSKDYYFYALDAKTGKLSWATDIDHQIVEEALVTNNNIIVHGIGMGLLPNAIYALRKIDGQVMWSTEGKGSATYPSSNGNVVYYGLSEDADVSTFSMHAVEASTGELLWTLELQGRRPEKIYSSSDLVYVTAFKGGGITLLPDNAVTFAPTTTYVYAVNASTGKLVWEYKGGEDLYGTAPLTVGPKHLFFVGKAGLYAIDKNTGKRVWFLAGKYVPYNMQYLDNIFYVNGDSTENNESYSAVNASSGELIWRAPYPGSIIGDAVYVSAGTSLIILNSKTGKKLRKFNMSRLIKKGTGISAAPAMFEGQLIFPTNTNIIWLREPIQGYLYSIDAHTGKLN